jgi:hypothetical protein
MFTVASIGYNKETKYWLSIRITHQANTRLQAAKSRLERYTGMDYHKRENIRTLTCPSEDDGLGASAEGITVGGFSFCFFSILFSSGGIIGASSYEIGTSTLVFTVLSKLVFACFEGGDFVDG